jgi:hypothetical protein
MRHNRLLDALAWVAMAAIVVVVYVYIPVVA